MHTIHFRMSRIRTAKFFAVLLSNYKKWNLDNGLAEMIGHGNFALSSDSKIFTISQHSRIYGSITLNGNGIYNTSITQNSITNRYPPDRTIHSLSLYIQSYQFLAGNHRPHGSTVYGKIPPT